jgi:hypothetical protein
VVLPVCTPHTEDTCSEANRLSVLLHAECMCPLEQVQRNVSLSIHEGMEGERRHSSTHS